MTFERPAAEASVDRPRNSARTPNHLEYLTRVERSQLVEPERLAGVVAALEEECRAAPPSAELLASRLLEANLLTPWQHRMLEHGRVKRFFLGQYKLLDQIGAGGMGKVYLAEHALMRRLVAVKVIAGHREDDATRIRRFIVEARATATLDHPHIVKVFHLDREFELYYLVMEYVAGIDLRKLAERERPLSCTRIARYGMEVADGLEHLHAHGLIHRDIKPANLLVDEHDRIKILDLGLARVTVGERESLTGDQRIVGTLDYMAPEQIRDGRSVDARTDLYSLGATMYFLLTGQPTFVGGTTIERMHRQLHAEPTPIESIRNDVPRRLAQICHQLLAKDPARRFPSAAEARAALDQWLRHTEGEVFSLSRVTGDDASSDAAAAEAGSDWFVRAATSDEVELPYARTAADLPRFGGPSSEPDVTRREHDESLDRLAQGVAHRFNNLLQCMLGELELAELELEADSRLNDSLYRISDAARRATDLTSQLLLCGGKVKCVRTVMPLEELVRTQSQLCRAYLPSHIRLQTELPKEFAAVSVDAAQLHRLLSQVILNAQEALEPQGGVVTLRAGIAAAPGESGVNALSGCSPSAEVFIEVQDDGPGVNEIVRRRMFEPFFSTRGGDRGLGLAVAKGIAAQHFGRLEAFSVEGHGLRIRLTMPCEESSAGALANSPSDGASQLAPRVLVVDDDASIRELVRRTLERFGFVVRMAINGNEALAALQQDERIELVVLDLTLPGMSGEVVFSELRALRPSLPVIVASGSNDSDVLNRLASSGGVEYLQKPYRPTVLVSTVRKVLQLRVSV